MYKLLQTWQGRTRDWSKLKTPPSLRFLCLISEDRSDCDSDSGKISTLSSCNWDLFAHCWCVYCLLILPSSKYFLLIFFRLRYGHHDYEFETHLTIITHSVIVIFKLILPWLPATITSFPVEYLYFYPVLSLHFEYAIICKSSRRLKDKNRHIMISLPSCPLSLLLYCILLLYNFVKIKKTRSLNGIKLYI